MLVFYLIEKKIGFKIWGETNNNLFFYIRSKT